MRSRLGMVTAAALIALGLAATASAQTACPEPGPCTVKVNAQFTAEANHEPDTVAGDTTGYRLYIDGAIVQTKLLSSFTITNGSVLVSFVVASGVSKGDHVLYVEAYGDGGATASNTMVVRGVPGKPKAPTGVRVVTP